MLLDPRAVAIQTRGRENDESAAEHLNFLSSPYQVVFGPINIFFQEKIQDSAYVIPIYTVM